MAKKKSSSPTTDGQKDSDKPPSPEAMDVTGAGALTGDGSAAMPGGGWASEHKGILIGGGIAVVVVVGYILIKSHGTASGAQSGSAMPVTDLLGGQTTPSTNSGGPGSSGYGGSGSATAIEKAITQMEDALHTQSQQNTLALQNALASQQASQSNAWRRFLKKVNPGGSSTITPGSSGGSANYGIPSGYTRVPNPTVAKDIVSTGGYLADNASRTTQYSLPSTVSTAQTNVNLGIPSGYVHVPNPTVAKELVAAGDYLHNNNSNTAQYTTPADLAAIYHSAN